MNCKTTNLKWVYGINVPMTMSFEQRVCRKLEVSVIETLSKRKTNEVCFARYIIWHYLYNNKLLTLSSIGERYGRHYSTVLSGLHQFNIMYETSATFRQTVNDLNYETRRL